MNGAVVVLLLIFTWQTYSLYKKSSDSDKWVMHTNEVLKTIRDANIHIKAADAANRSFILTNNAAFVQDYNRSSREAINAIQKLVILTRDNHIQRAKLEELSFLLEEKEKVTQRLIDLFPADKYRVNAPDLPEDLVKLNVSIQSGIREFENAEDQLLEERSAMNRINSINRVLFSIMAFFIIVAFLVFTIFKIRQNIEKRASAEERVRIQEEKYRMLVERSGVSMLLVDSEGIIRLASLNLQDLIGYGPDELNGTPITDYIAGPYRQPFNNALAAVSNADNYNNIIEFRIRTHGNTQKLVSCRISPANLSPTGVKEWQLILWDIDEDQKMHMELKLLRQEAKEQQSLVQEVIDNIPMVVFIKDAKGRYRIINKAMQDVMGLAASGIVGKSDRQLNIDPQKLERYLRSDEEVLKYKRLVTMEDTVEINNNIHYFWVTKLPLFNERQEVKYISGISADITAFKEVELKLMNAKEDADDARAAQEVFLANISHEIRTPMNGVLGMTNLLMDTSLDRHQKEFCESIRESAANLLTLINDLLDISKVRSGKFRLESIPFNVKDVVNKALYPLQFKAKEKHIGLNLRFMDPQEEVLVGDPLRLQQIIINLSSNAIKFTEVGSVGVSVGSEKVDDDKVLLKVEITDTGIGIAEDKLKDIFESYTQSNTNTPRIYGGTGLGLTIVKQLVELQHGRVWVNSVSGKGSVFSFEIPYKISFEGKGNMDNTVKADNLNIMKGLNILVAEDNLINQKVVKYTLQKAGADVTLVANGLEALAALKERYYDVVLMDMQMPEMDGYQATKYIRETLKSTVPVIAMTANALSGEAQKCLDAGASGYISKPFDPATLCEQILRLASIYKSDRETVVMDEDEDAVPLVDFSYVIELAGEKGDYLKQVLTIFMDNTPQGLNELQDLIRNTEDWKAIATQAHYLKSSVGIVKIRGMHEGLQQIETISGSPAPDKKKITAILEELMTTFAEAEVIILREMEESV